MTLEDKKRICAVCLICFCVSIACTCFAAEKMRIAAIKSSDITPYTTALAGFRDYLNRQKIDFALTEFDLKGKAGEDIASSIKEIVSGKPSLILTLGVSATTIVQERIKDIPIVFTMVLDPAGNNITVPGVAIDVTFEEKLEKLKDILPRAKKVGLVYSQNSLPAYEELARISEQFGLQLIDRKIATEKEFAEAVRGISGQIDYFLMVADPTIYFPKAVEFLLHEGLDKKFPIIGLSSAYTKAGALVSFDCDYKDAGELAGELALAIIEGKRVSNARFVVARKITISFNLSVANQLELEIPVGALQQAREVFGR